MSGLLAFVASAARVGTYCSIQGGLVRFECARYLAVLGLLAVCGVGCEYETGVPSTVVVASTSAASPVTATLPASATRTSATTTDPTLAVTATSDERAETVASLEAIAAEPTPTISGTIGTLAIPALDRVVPIVSVGWRVDEIDGAQLAVWETVNDAAGHHRGSSPLGGEGHCVLSGHSNPDSGGVFAGIWDLQPGDTIDVRGGDGQVYPYVVNSVEKVQETGASLEERLAHAEVMEPTDDARLTLITCWPDWAYTHRVVVVARRLDTE